MKTPAHSPVHVTLTYPQDPGGDACKRDLAAFRRRLERRFPGVVGFWKLEFQRRGVPHWHLLVWLPAATSVTAFRYWLWATWAEVVGVDHARVGAEPRSAWNTARYFVGYGAKETAKSYQNEPPPSWEKTGRWWGAWGLTEAWVEIPVSIEEHKLLRRVLRRYREAGCRRVCVARGTRALGMPGLWVIGQGDGTLLGALAKLLPRLAEA